MTNTIVSAGIILLEGDFQLITFNLAALQILAFPTSTDRILQPEAFLQDRIKKRLLKQPSNGNGNHLAHSNSQLVKEYKSGGRQYTCNVFHMSASANGTVSGKSTSRITIVLERQVSFEDVLENSLNRYDLTRREAETVRHLVSGLTSKEIADQMRVSPNTVKSFLRIVMVKMRCTTRTGIVGKIISPRSPVAIYSRDDDKYIDREKLNGTSSNRIPHEEKLRLLRPSLS